MEPGTVFKNAENYIAIRTDPAVTAGDWFVYHPRHGGGYVPERPGEPEDWVQGSFPDFPSKQSES